MWVKVRACVRGGGDKSGAGRGEEGGGGGVLHLNTPVFAALHCRLLLKRTILEIAAAINGGLDDPADPISVTVDRIAFCTSRRLGFRISWIEISVVTQARLVARAPVILQPPGEIVTGCPCAALHRAA